MTAEALADQPTLSVIVITYNGGRMLSRCLDVLAPQITAGESELLVVGDERSETDLREVMARLPQARFLAAPAGETIPQMRRRGIEGSRGRLAAMIEDDCLVGPEWCAGIIAAHRSPAPAIGGAVDPDQYERRRDWAIYFCEYGRFISPFAGPAAALSGNNVSYKRDRLLALPAGDEGFYEYFAHQQWREAGESLLAEPRMALRNVRRWRSENLSSVPYHHARAFAGIRAETFSRGKRLFHAGLSIGLPLLYVGRIIRALQRRPRLWGKFLAALPWILAFTFSWAIGEIVGYLWGAGESRSRWR